MVVNSAAPLAYKIPMITTMLVPKHRRCHPLFASHDFGCESHQDYIKVGRVITLLSHTRQRALFINFKVSLESQLRQCQSTQILREPPVRCCPSPKETLPSSFPQSTRSLSLNQTWVVNRKLTKLATNHGYHSCVRKYAENHSSADGRLVPH